MGHNAYSITLYPRRKLTRIAKFPRSNEPLASEMNDWSNPQGVLFSSARNHRKRTMMNWLDISQGLHRICSLPRTRLLDHPTMWSWIPTSFSTPFGRKWICSLRWWICMWNGMNALFFSGILLTRFSFFNSGFTQNVFRLSRIARLQNSRRWAINSA